MIKYQMKYTYRRNTCIIREFIITDIKSKLHALKTAWIQRLLTSKSIILEILEG